MLVVSWNMGRNSTSRSRAVHDRAWHYLAALDPDIALVQEASPPEWARDRWTISKPSSYWWGAAVAARPDLDPRPLPGDRTDAMAAVSVRHPGGGDLLVVSVHAPAGKATEVQLVGRDAASFRLPRSKVTYYRDVAYADSRDLVRGRRFLVAGDWNTSPILDDQLHPGRHEGDFFVRAADDGWEDCYRRFHATEGRTYFHSGHAPYQTDHAFCDAETSATLRSCEIDPHPAEPMGLSDHAPLVLRLEPEPAARTSA